MPSPVSFDRIADRYDQTRGGAGRGVLVAADLDPWLVPGAVLEVAVGTGVVASALSDAGHPVFGIDISPEMLRYAHERLGPRVLLGDARQLPIADSSVDNAIFVMALHLVGDVRAALHEAARVVRPGGRIAAVHGAMRGGEGGEGTDIAKATDMLDRVRPPSPPDGVDEVLLAAREIGLAQIHAGWTSPYPHDRTPREVAAEVESRTWSYLWDVPDTTWQEFVVPTIEALRALPDQDRVRSWPRQHRLTAFAVP
jgi:SAM-dependent methyltransferase